MGGRVIPVKPPRAMPSAAIRQLAGNAAGFREFALSIPIRL
jgi:hypothetical protein